jgi:hypothetical protein
MNVQLRVTVIVNVVITVQLRLTVTIDPQVKEENEGRNNTVEARALREVATK